MLGIAALMSVQTFDMTKMKNLKSEDANEVKSIQRPNFVSLCHDCLPHFLESHQVTMTDELPMLKNKKLPPAPPFLVAFPLLLSQPECGLGLGRTEHFLDRLGGGA